MSLRSAAHEPPCSRRPRSFHRVGTILPAIISEWAGIGAVCDLVTVRLAPSLTPKSTPSLIPPAPPPFVGPPSLRWTTGRPPRSRRRGVPGLFSGCSPNRRSSSGTGRRVGQVRRPVTSCTPSTSHDHIVDARDGTRGPLSLPRSDAWVGPSSLGRGAGAGRRGGGPSVSACSSRHRARQARGRAEHPGARSRRRRRAAGRHARRRAQDRRAARSDAADPWLRAITRTACRASSWGRAGALPFPDERAPGARPDPGGCLLERRALREPGFGTPGRTSPNTCPAGRPAALLPSDVSSYDQIAALREVPRRHRPQQDEPRPGETGGGPGNTADLGQDDAAALHQRTCRREAEEMPAAAQRGVLADVVREHLRTRTSSAHRGRRGRTADDDRAFAVRVMEADLGGGESGSAWSRWWPVATGGIWRADSSSSASASRPSCSA